MSIFGNRAAVSLFFFLFGNEIHIILETITDNEISNPAQNDPLSRELWFPNFALMANSNLTLKHVALLQLSIIV